MDEHLAVGSAALREGRWEDARTAFEQALAEREIAEALDDGWLGLITIAADRT